MTYNDGNGFLVLVLEGACITCIDFRALNEGIELRGGWNTDENN